MNLERLSYFYNKLPTIIPALLLLLCITALPGQSAPVALRAETEWVSRYNDTTGRNTALYAGAPKRYLNSRAELFFTKYIPLLTTNLFARVKLKLALIEMSAHNNRLHFLSVRTIAATAAPDKA